jgi:NDP-sugar pyrophosphorylase family protein
MGDLVKPKVLITTSGLGSRLGEKTDYTNKCLIRIDSKPVISHIIESYPNECEFIITLGHYGNLVKDYILLSHSDRNFTFVEVDKYSGQGSSLGYSLLQTKQHLQCPFIFHASDTILLDTCFNVSENWVVSSTKKDTSQYRTLKVQNNKVISIEEKGSSNSDFVYTGVCGIKNYKHFWSYLEEIYNKNPNDTTLSDCHVLREMVKKDFCFYNLKKEFFDTGNITELKATRDFFVSNMTVLDKLEEDTFILENCVVKFFHNKKIVKDRVIRAKKLTPCVPKILQVKDNFYAYEFIDGDLFSECVDTQTFFNFLQWSKDNLWKLTKKDIKKECHNFYYEKTLKRIKLFIDEYGESDLKINGIKCEKVHTLIEDIKDFLLEEPICSNIHGDFILDNVIKTNDGNFSLIDWRQNFGEGVYDYGDIYYDLAKLNHNLTFNHYIVDNEHYKLKVTDDEILIDIYRKHILCECQDIFYNFLKEEGYSLIKTKILTSIVWLNMSPLHEYPLNKFLFYFGKYNLQRSINEYKNNA